MLRKAKTLILLLSLTLAAAGKKKSGENQNEAKWGDKYDFIIIGGGTAGSVVASRLSEVPEWKVLLLEAGSTSSFYSTVPAMAPVLQLTESNWKYFTAPQSSTFEGLNDNVMMWSSGKAYGGSSAINYMMYTRGNEEDYDNWEKLGNPGWSYKDVLPYFLKSERANLEYADREFHNRSGPLSVEYSYSGELAAEFLKSAKKLGYNIIDYNGKNQLGFSMIQAFLKDGARQTTSSAFLDSFAASRPNLEIVTTARVTRLNFNPKNKKVKSVKFQKDGKRYRAMVTKEVILSGGTFGSPQILMLSGIGPKDHLKENEIESLIDLPVGQNLQDHVTYPGLNFITNSNKTQFNIIKDYITEMPYWYMSGKGVLASLAGFEAIGFIKLPTSPPTQKKPDVEILFMNYFVNAAFERIMNLKDDFYKNLYNGTEKLIRMSIYPTLLHPKSKGQLRLKSKNPLEAPILSSNYFSEKDDLKAMIEGIKVALKFIETEEFRVMDAQLNPNPVPGCDPKRSMDQYWECALRSMALTSFDPFGTCRMGSKSDPKAIVDENLKVHGTLNLRVVDASVIPSTISGHLAAATVMIAEKASDILKKTHSK